MNLTEHFTLEEFTRTDLRDLQQQNADDGAAFMMALTATARVLEQVRALFPGKAIIVNSAFRCPAVNEAVGSNPNSQHMVGEAVDFNIEGMMSQADRLHAFQAIGGCGIPFHQLLIEGGCIHLGRYRMAGPYNGEMAYWAEGSKVIIRAGVPA